VTRDWVSIAIEADLSAVVQQRALFWIALHPELGYTAVVAGADPHRWGISVGYDPAELTHPPRQRVILPECSGDG
jgi:hypothetical protein